MRLSYRSILDELSYKARDTRARWFRELFRLSPETKILDLGTENGVYIAHVLEGTTVHPENVYAADIVPDSISAAQRVFGFTPILVSETGPLPFPDRHFDIVFCNSVIEHVTLPKDELRSVTSERVFRTRSLARQKDFADEIRRLGKGFWVQTPNRWFPIDPHTFIPLGSWLPRYALMAAMRFTHPGAIPDWNLLSAAELRNLFPECEILSERVLGLVKSIIALKRIEANTGAGP